MRPAPVRLARRLVPALALLLATACSQADDGPPDEGAISPSASGATSTAASDSPASDSTAACEDVAASVAALVQEYVDQYAPTDALATSDRRSDQPVDGAASAPDLPGEIEAAQRRLRDLGCRAEDVSGTLASGLAEVTAEGPVALAVRDQLTASLLGRVPASATTVEVGTDADLRTVLPELAPGSTVRLSAGRHRLDETLVLLRGVRLVGAGSGRTTVISTAAETAVLALSPDRLDLVDLTVRHRGSNAASLVTGSSQTRLALTGVELTGARQGGDGQPGGRAAAVGGTALSLPGDQQGDGETSLEITDSVFRDNDVAGVLLGGAHVASIRASTFERNGQCAVCFTGASSGELRDAQISGGSAGVIATGSATPLVTGATIRSVAVGIQASDGSTVVVRDSTVRGARRVALLFGDRSRGRVQRVACPGSEAGIGVSPKALPFVGRNDCAVVPAR